MFSPEDKLLQRIAENRAAGMLDSDHGEEEDAVNCFLGPGIKYRFPIAVPRYYGRLLAWMLQLCINRDNWHVNEVVASTGHDAPRYASVSVAPGRHTSFLVNGRMLLSQNSNNVVVQIIEPYYDNAFLSIICTEASSSAAERLYKLVDHAVAQLKPYKGMKLRYDGQIHFLQPSKAVWGDLSLPLELHDEIIENTVDFLKRSRQLAAYGIPSKRGIILAGAPGTGKTLVSRVLINNSPRITCLSAEPPLLVEPQYIHNLYQIAQDLMPSIVFLEDIDLIVGVREALNGLLDILDGVEERRQVVTVATTNAPELLHKALSQRPARFDRTIHLPLPDSSLRARIVKNLSRKIPVGVDVQDYIVTRTEGYTPAQIQEIMYSLVIRQKDIADGQIAFTIEHVDDILRRVSHKNGSFIGFKI